MGAMWCWWWSGSVHDVRSDVGEALDDTLHTDVRLLELLSYSPQEYVKICSMVGDGRSCCLVSHVCVMIDCCCE